MPSILDDLAKGATSGVFSGVGDMAVKLRQAFKGVEIDPSKTAEIELTIAQLENSIVLAQSAVNLEDAKSERWFQSGWRPFAGWVSGIGLAIQFLIFPLAILIGYEVPSYDFSELINLLIAMLGLGVMRTFEKRTGVA